MIAAHKFCRWEISSSSSQLAGLFAETMRNGQISFTDWNDLITAPVDRSFTSDDEDVLTRMIYGVRHGFVKVI
ncbi:hypothetical protein [Limnofasciculus baicalensis]|uniref:Uncharacterized protein n=1 Tax=Limnofasciculus baicalensis BBK-W-15 TaxID=2699891 RepID=A0AAE3KMS4_9CYAN|nr:hypothetical protein [Limnofasciculus baicalensis]MCP2729524.1 hypothetical protein [Limnofasciculus baicalensis BBK-W-15]